MAHAIAKKEGRSLNKQLIQMIHQYAILHEIKSEPIVEQPDKYQAITSDNEDYFAGNQGRSIEMGMTKEEFENHDYDEPTESGLQKLSEIKKSDSAD